MSITINMVVSGDIAGDPLGTFTGPIVSFTSKKAKPIVEINGEITAQQNLHGYSKPWAGGSGINKLDRSTETSGIKLNNNGTTSSASNSIVSDYIPVTGGASYYFIDMKGSNSGVGLCEYDSSKTFVAYQTFYGSGKKAGAKTLNASTAFIRLSYYLDSYDAAVNYPSTETSFYPYSNICPITGLTEANIFQEAAYDAGATAKRTVAFGQTVYGGNYNIDENGGVTLEITDAVIASYAGEALPSTWISDRDEYAVGTTPTTGAQVVYKIASPSTTTLSSVTMLNTLVGTNEMWTDTGDITVKAYGKENSINTLQSLNMLLGNAYVNNHTPEDVSDEEALDIIMGESR